jgi:hypothetical protein
MKTKPIPFLSVLRCFNVAAICALGVWHGYLFYASHFQSPVQTQNSIQFHYKTPTSPAHVNRT